jgi:NAD(P)-dependent dehydrogenase (short-subunit alcohol dehydrogenase family)
MGQAMAEQFAREGADVAVTFHNDRAGANRSAQDGLRDDVKSITACMGPKLRVPKNTEGLPSRMVELSLSIEGLTDGVSLMSGRLA